MCLYVTGYVVGVCAANRGKQQGGVTVGDDGGDTLVIGATLGSGAWSKHFGGGIIVLKGMQVVRVVRVEPAVMS